MFTIPKWVVYSCYTHITLYGFPVLSQNVRLLVWQSNMAQTWQWKIPYKWSFEEDHHWFSWSLFQPAMFDYRKGTCLEVDATATKGHNWASDTKPSPSAKVRTRAVAAWDHGQHQLMKLAVFFSGFSIINHPALEGLRPPLDSGNLVLPKFPHTEPRSAPTAHDLAELKNNDFILWKSDPDFSDGSETGNKWIQMVIQW